MVTPVEAADAVSEGKNVLQIVGTVTDHVWDLLNPVVI